MGDTTSDKGTSVVPVAQAIAQPEETALAPVVSWGNGSAPPLPSVDNEDVVSWPNNLEVWCYAGYLHADNYPPDRH
jgi:hypothetical protein